MALAAFNVFDFDTIRAVADAAREAQSEIYLQFSSSTVSYYGAERLAEIVKVACAGSREYVKIHLDHCTDFNLIGDCIRYGWDSVMGDFSHLSLQENINNMKKIKLMANPVNALVEGELGQVAGVEDGHGTDGGSFVSTSDVSQFVQETEVDLLAVGIGNAHGYYKSTDSIDVSLLKSVHEIAPLQKLVLHGGTGIDVDMLEAMKQYGIHKINISTELKDVYIKSITEHSMSSKRFNMIGLVDCRFNAVKEYAKGKIQEFK